MSINQMSWSSYWALQAPMHYYCRHQNSLRYVASGFFLFDLLLACPWGVILAQQSMVNIDTGGNRHSCKVFSSHPESKFTSSWPVALRVPLVTVWTPNQPTQRSLSQWCQKTMWPSRQLLNCGFTRSAYASVFAHVFAHVCWHICSHVSTNVWKRLDMEKVSNSQGCQSSEDI